MSCRLTVGGKNKRWPVVLPSASFVFRLLELGRFEAKDPNDHGRRANDSPLHYGHMLHAVANAAGDLGDEIGYVLHDLVFKYDRWDLTKPLNA